MLSPNSYLRVTANYIDEQEEHFIYSYFEKGCPAKLYATMPKAIMGNGVHGL